jgi:hypothetical protein
METLKLILLTIPFTGLKASVSKYVKNLWQTDWNENVNNKLHDINPTVSKIQNGILK